MKKKNNRLYLGFGIFFLLGCAIIFVLLRTIYTVPASLPDVPTSSPLAPEAINTIIFDTAIAAASQTAGVSGTQTSQFYTPTFTLTNTPLGGAPTKSNKTPLPGESIPFVYESPTLYIVPKWTPSRTPTKTPRKGVAATTPANKKTKTALVEDNAYLTNPAGYNCQIVSVERVPNMDYAIGQGFTIKWVVNNTGPDWSQTSVDVVYAAGNVKVFEVDYDIDKNVNRGEQITISVPMEATIIGTIPITWKLRVGKVYFCALNVNITVK